MGKESVGGGWIKKSKAGKEYISLTIGEEKFVMFQNEYKQGKQPDYRIFKSEPMPDYPKKQEPKAKTLTEQALEYSIDDDKIPF